jgi:Rod binding domain-containing protein
MSTTNGIGIPHQIDTPSPARPDRAQETAEAFETVFLTQFVDEMMKTVSPTAFGGKQQAEMWRSFMSEAVAKSLVEQGGVGLTGNVKEMISAYGGRAAAPSNGSDNS